MERPTGCVVLALALVVFITQLNGIKCDNGNDGVELFDVILKANEGIFKLKHSANFDGVVEEGDTKYEVVEGDVVLEITEDGSSRKRRSIMRNRTRIWRTRVIPYSIDTTLVEGSAESNAIIEVIEMFNNSPYLCLKFIERTTEIDYISFYKGLGCSSHVGRIGGMQPISIGTGCGFTGVVAHEIMHALGFWHEHSRPDRDNYVRVNFTNIVPGMEHNFIINPIEYSEAFSHYDYLSVMHYSSHAFSVDNLHKKTIETPQKDIVIGQRDGPSKLDYKSMCYLYSCTTPDHTWSPYTPCQYCGQIRQRICFGPDSSACDPSIPNGIEHHQTACPCNAAAYWSDWNEWSLCSASCNSGIRYRMKTCHNGIPGAIGCQGNDVEEEACNVLPCVEWTAWSAWTTCSKQCDGGACDRVRQCQNGIPGDGGCQGDEIQTSPCNTTPCVFWKEWGEWSICSKHCGGGMQKRERDCHGAKPGEDRCQGSDIETIPCNTHDCDCVYWSEWSPWSECSESCDRGEKTRSRHCFGGEPGEKGCIGEGEESKKCNLRSCGPGLVSCSFDDGNMCYWRNRRKGKWRRTTGANQTLNNAPQHDHTTGHGHYIIAKSRRGGRNNRSYRLESPLINPGIKTVCFQMSYHMNGSNTQFFKVYAVTWRRRKIRRVFIGGRVGKQGDYWLEFKKTIRVEKKFKVHIDAMVARRNSDISLDDIHIRQGNC